MAGGIDWFRWHHGSVTDPKFGLIAKKAGVRVSDAIAMWAFVLENASAEAERGAIGQLDFEAIEHLLGLEDGQAVRILDAMTQRGLIEGSRIASWDKRQPKRERDTDSSAERTRAYRERQKQASDDATNPVTPCDATERQRNARGEERREEEREEGENPPVGSADPCPHQQVIDLYHEVLPAARRIRDWTPARQSALRARWRERPDRQSLDWWNNFFGYVAKSDFLCGRAPTSGGRKPFELSLDWLCKSENFVKVLEGAYEN